MAEDLLRHGGSRAGGRKAGTGNNTMLGEAPCDACSRQDKCKREGLCCRDYIHYMKKGTVINIDRTPFMPVSSI